MILGVGFYSYVMGNFSSMLAAKDKEKYKLQVSMKLILLEPFGRTQ